MKRLLMILALVCAATAAVGQNSKTLEVKPVAGPLAGRTLYTNSHALLIGISQYQHLPADKHLQFAHKDARALREALVKSYGFPAENITLLLNEQATKAAIEKALSNFADAKRVGRDDRLLVYFSGHGQTVTLPDAGEMGFLIPHDARVDLGQPNNAGPYLDTCVEMDGLWKYLRGCPAKHALVLADACFSGLLVQSRALGEREKLNANELAKQAARPARQVLTAGGKGEEALEDPALGHGAFTYKLLEELRAEAAVAGEVFTATDLAAALKRSVSNLTNGKQSPVFGSYRTEGEFLFVSTPPQPVAPTPSPVTVTAKPTGPQPGEVRKNPIDGAEMVYVPPGEFLMGSEPAEIDAQWRRFGWPKELKRFTKYEVPVHRVRISRGYWLYRTEVTVAQYRAFCNATAHALPAAPDWGWEDNHPVVNVSWEDAQAYCRWSGTRLPTEAEWEYAARGRNTGLGGKARLVFPWGDDLPRGTARVGNFADERVKKSKFYKKNLLISTGYDDGYIYAAPAGSYSPFGFGLHDLEGNVAEWCADWYREDYYRQSPTEDPIGPVKGSKRALRGSTYLTSPSFLRIGGRVGLKPDIRSAFLGFRPARGE